MSDTKKHWPKEYYATKYECTLKHLRKASLKSSKRNGVLGWRKNDKYNSN